jgi:hypothetical protein
VSERREVEPRLRMRLAVICPGLHHLARSLLAAAADDLDPRGRTSGTARRARHIRTRADRPTGDHRVRLADLAGVAAAEAGYFGHSSARTARRLRRSPSSLNVSAQPRPRRLRRRPLQRCRGIRRGCAGSRSASCGVRRRWPFSSVIAWRRCIVDNGKTEGAQLLERPNDKGARPRSRAPSG